METARHSNLGSRSAYWLLPIAVWTLLVVASLIWNVNLNRSHAFEMAAERGRVLFQSIEITRKWNAKHGGVFAPTTENNPPNPYLYPGLRSMTDSSGNSYTRINPAYMTRQISELADNYGFNFHLTSLKPLRPENEPDSWERESLTAFEQGITERTSLIETPEKKLFRYMAPLKVEPSCLACHAHQGYRVDDIRGGISINIDARQIFDNIYNTVAIIILFHLLLWGSISYLMSAPLLRSHAGKHASITSPSPRRTTRKAVAPISMALPESSNVQLDNISGLPTLEQFKKSAPSLWKQAMARHQPIAYLAIEIDQFQSYLEQYGHLEADLCLRQVGSQVERFAHGSHAICAHTGVTSFAILKLGLSERMMVNLATSLCEEVEAMKIRHRRATHAKVVTITCAATLLKQVTHSQNLDDFIAGANSCLQRAKSEQRYGIINCTSD